MDGPMPDPSTLDDGTGDDDVPLNVVREKAIGERERSASLRSASGTMAPPPTRKVTQNVDLFGDDEPVAPARPSTTEPAVQRPAAQKATAAPPKQTRPGESLLGLDFFGGTQTAPPARPSSTGPSTPGVPGRADLKSSILSLYASKPAAGPQPPPQPQQQPQSNMGAFAGMQSPPLTSPTQPQSNNSGFGGMNDAFSSLSFASPQQPAAKPSPFAGLTSPSGHTRQTSATKSSLSGGSFFDMKPAAPAKPTSPPIQQAPAPRKESFGGDWGDFSAASPVTSTSSATKSPPATTSSMGALFNMGAPSPPPKPAPPAQPAQRQPSIPSTYSSNNAFNLSSQPPKPQPTSPPLPQASNFASLNSTDAWGSNDAWAAPDPPAQPAAQPSTANTFKPAPPPAMQTPFDSGWGDMTSPTVAPQASQTKPSNAGGFSVQADEEFGGWSHASPVATSAGGVGSKPSGGFGGTSDDLFGNVWE
jgi:stromal membrane-associated protein